MGLVARLMSNLWITAAGASQDPWVPDPQDGREVCRTCGYNKPYHAHGCAERGLTGLQLRHEYANMSDAQVREPCVRCGRRIGSGGAVIENGGLAHKFDCTAPGVW
jgi:hypothetical protein